MDRFDFDKAVEKFFDYAPVDFDKTPCEKFSTKRMGGWAMKDNNDMAIGFVRFSGGVDVLDYVDTSADTVQSIADIDEKFAEMKLTKRRGL
tara:strand:+ start:204 stop:476 length:273 start_codon:yes stop_codon:yes gene_type:complete